MIQAALKKERAHERLLSVALGSAILVEEEEAVHSFAFSFHLGMVPLFCEPDHLRITTSSGYNYGKLPNTIHL